MMDKKSLFLLLFLPTSAIYASDDTSPDPFLGTFSGNIALTSNYIFRGISETNNGPAVQGGLTYTLAEFYATLSGSNVDFGNGGNAHLELDPEVGYSHEFKNGVHFDTSILRYTYPHASNLDYFEEFAVLGYKYITLTTSYSDNVFNSGGSGFYINLGVDYPIKKLYDIHLIGSAGNYALASVAGPSYSDYKIGISKQFKKWVAEIDWTDTANAVVIPANLAGSKIVGTLSMNF